MWIVSGLPSLAAFRPARFFYQQLVHIVDKLFACCVDIRSAVDFRAPLKSCSASQLLRRPVPEILMYVAYTPVPVLRPPCTRLAHGTF